MRAPNILVFTLGFFLLSSLVPINDALAATTFVDALVLDSIDEDPIDLAFNNDGTKMFVVGNNDNEVVEFNCSTGYDISTCSDASSPLDVSLVEGTVGGLAFNSDGTKMFLAGEDNGGDVYEFSCTSFDVSTCNNNAGANDKDISGEETTPVGLAFNSDGTKMFIAGDSNTEIIEYNCTSFDVSTCSDASDELDVSGQIGNQLGGIAFSSNGQKMFVLDADDKEVNQYSCSTGFDVSTCTHDNVFSTTATATNGPSGLAFSSNGLTMIFVGSDADGAGSGDADVYEYTLDVAFDMFSSATTTSDSGGSGGGNSDQRHKTKPTFGLDHNTNRLLIEGGFSFNGKSHDITDNFWTPFEEQEVKVGTMNTFASKVYADKQLRVQEFLFGIPNVGDAHKAELGVEIHYGYDGSIENVKVIQKTGIVDDSIKVITQKSKCRGDDDVKRCVTTLLTMKFLEPLQDKVMAIKAIDFKGRYNITYLNEGLDISGKSLNPMKVKTIPDPQRFVGLVDVTQTEKYSNVWVAKDGREFLMNDFGTFIQINRSVEHHVDDGEIKNRLHSEFNKIKFFENELATKKLLDICPLCFERYSDLDDPLSYEYHSIDRLEKITPLMEIENQKAIQFLIDANEDISYPEYLIEKEDRAISKILDEERFME
ncbi:MAG: YncE family protein [Candidatus Nitrosopumilus sp. bin_7KS]